MLRSWMRQPWDTGGPQPGAVLWEPPLPSIPSALIASVYGPPTLQPGTAQVWLPSRRTFPRGGQGRMLGPGFLGLLGCGRPPLSVSNTVL